MSSADVQPRQLITTVLLSIVLAVVVLVLFVLPAEYNIDATGLGAKMGLTGMAGYQVSALSAEEQSFVSDYVEFPLAPFESIEYKYTLGEGQALMFEWQAEGELVFDFHSEEEGTLPEDSVSFSIGRDDSQRGTYVAPYPGVHGWFWENRGAEEVTVKLKTTGFFTESTTYSPSGEFKRDFSVD
ncbi:MAG: hypothetical protein NXH95_01785 [Pseudomonadaceae bacterium]|nr:hypothetical protein [Pseudomonadaceae bacterium]